MQIFGFCPPSLPEIVIFFARGEIDPFRLAASRQATFPKGTAFGGGDKVSGSAQRRPLEGRLPPLRGKMSRSDKRGNLAKPLGFD